MPDRVWPYFLVAVLGTISGQTTVAEPYPLIWYDHAASIDPLSQLDRKINLGITQRIVYCPSANFETTRQMLEAAETAGVEVILDLGRDLIADLDEGQPERLDQIARQIDAVKDHAALAGWYIFDEPDEVGISVAEAQAVYDLVRARSDLPIYGAINVEKDAVQRAYRDSYDVLAGFRYPFGVASDEFAGLEDGGFLGLQPGWKTRVAVGAAAARSLGKKFVNTVQAYGHDRFDTRLPTVNELRFMVFYSILCQDADGIAFYRRHGLEALPAQPGRPYPGDGPAWVEEVLAPLVADFDQHYGPALAAGPLAPEPSVSGQGVTARRFRDPADGRCFLLAVNETDRVIDATIRLDPALPFVAARSLEDGDLREMVGCELSLKFTRYQVTAWELIPAAADVTAKPRQDLTVTLQD